MEIKSEQDFCCRIVHNLKLYKEAHSSNAEEWEYETTRLVNSFLCLLVVIKEKTQKQNGVEFLSEAELAIEDIKYLVDEISNIFLSADGYNKPKCGALK